MTYWREAPSSVNARRQTYAAAVAHGADAARQPAPLLSPHALKRIVCEGNLPLSDAAKGAKSELESVLEQLAHRFMHSEAFNGPALSVADDLEKMLRVWKRMHSTRKGVREKANAEMRELICKAANKGAYGPIPPPVEHPAIFERWLADVALARSIEWDLMAKCLDAATLAEAERKALRVTETMAAIGRDRAQRRSLNGGAPANRERDLRTVKLLTVFWLLFAKEPNGAIAKTRPTRGGAWSNDPSDGGCATRFIWRFEKELERVIKERALHDPTRAAGRPCRWRADTLPTVNTRVRRLLDWRGDLNEFGELGSAYAHARPWERWTLAANAQGSFLPMLARTR